MRKKEMPDVGKSDDFVRERGKEGSAKLNTIRRHQRAMRAVAKLNKNCFCQFKFKKSVEILKKTSLFIEQF
jgi:hypothetical protein